MLAWSDLSQLLVDELLDQIGEIPRQLIEVVPLRLPQQHWHRALRCVCVRLGWVTDSAKSEKTLQKEITQALQLCGSDGGPLTFKQATQVFQHVARASSASLGDCPDDLIASSQGKLTAALRKKFATQLFQRREASAAASCSVDKGFLAHKKVSVSTASSHRSLDTTSAIVPRSSPKSSPRSSPRSSRAASDVTAEGSVQGMQLVPAQPDGSAETLVSMPSIPQLPSNMDDMSASELRKALLANHAEWIRTANQLAVIAHSPNSRSQKLRKAEGRKVRYWKGMAAKARSQKRVADHKLRQVVLENSLYTRSKRRKASAFRDRLTTFGGYKLALARNVGHSSCSATLSMLEADNTHRTSLVRWEHLLAGTVVTDQQHWHRLGKDCVAKSGLFTYQVHIVRGDATNSSAAQRSKVHACATRSTYCSALESGMLVDEEGEEILGQMPFEDRVHNGFADLQFVSTSCTARDLLEIYNKQLDNIGVPTFQPQDVDSDSSLRLFLHVTDDGADQKGCEKLIKGNLKLDGKTLYHRFKCMLHQIHLVVSKQLKRLPGHYNDIAKVVHTWRATGCSFKIRKAYTKKFGAARAKVVRKLPPRPLKGRWGSISSVERYLLNAGMAELPVVFNDAIATMEDHNADHGEDNTVDLDALDVQDMDSKIYKKIMGRWRKDANRALATTSFWARMHIANVTREPLDHLMHFLMQTASDPSDGGQAESQPERSVGKLPSLVYHKMPEIMHSFSDVLNSTSPRWNAFQSILNHESQDTVHEWVSLLVSCALECASELHRRVEAMTASYPAKLAWLVFTNDPVTPCDMRRKIAKELVESRPELLDEHFTRKFVSLFREDLELSKKSGCIEPMLFQLLSEAFRMLPLETQEVEGINSIVKRIVKIAPSIKLPLLSDRVLIKKALSTKILAGQTADERREARHDALHRCVEWHPAAILQCGALMMEDRFGRADDAELERALPLQDADIEAAWLSGLGPLGDDDRGDGCADPSENQALLSQPRLWA